MKAWSVLTVLLLAIAGVVGCTVNPVTGERQFSLITESQEKAIGEEQYPIMTQVSGGEFQNAELQSYVNEVGRKVAARSHRSDVEYEFNVVNSSELNAYALPGGKISITRGLLNEMSNEAQLAAVLGHEIGHVAARHVADLLTKQMTLNLTLGTLSAFLRRREVKYREYYSFAGLLASQLMLMKFSRDDERQADQLGMEYMVKAGYRAEGFVQLLEILQAAHMREPSVVEDWFSSHPMTRERIQAARDFAAQNPGPPDAVLGESEFRRKTAILRDVRIAYQHYDKAESLIAKGRVKEAIAEYEEAIKLRPDQYIFYSDLAFAYLKDGQLSKARSNIEKALSLYPDLFQSRFISGLIHCQLGDYDRALSEYAAADKLIPGQPAVKYQQGICYEKQGNKAAALAKYKEVIETAADTDYAKKSQERIDALSADDDANPQQK